MSEGPITFNRILLLIAALGTVATAIGSQGFLENHWGVDCRQAVMPKRYSDRREVLLDAVAKREKIDDAIQWVVSKNMRLRDWAFVEGSPAQEQGIPERLGEDHDYLLQFNGVEWVVKDKHDVGLTKDTKDIPDNDGASDVLTCAEKAPSLNP
jgi:hypothetical protein